MLDPSVALETLLALTRELRSDRPLESALREVTTSALRLLLANHASVRLLDESGTKLLAAVRSGAGSDRRPREFRRSEGAIGWVVEHGHALRLNDARSDARFKRKLAPQGFIIGSMLAVPMWSGGKVIGVLSVSSDQTGAFTDQDEQLLQLLANCAVPPIERARLERLAVVDAHTMAFRQSYLMPRLREELTRCARHGTPISILFMDLDHFKRVNDEHGHAVGDRVLRAFADRVRQSVRLSDVLVRRGGEEFVVILSNMSLADATLAAERIRLALTEEPFEVGSDLLLPQTVSVGVATWDGAESAEQLEQRADSAMYAAKQAGRNRVCQSPAPQP